MPCRPLRRPLVLHSNVVRRTLKLTQLTDGNSRTEFIVLVRAATCCRTPCRWYSAFHNVTAIVGAGVLGLPSAFSYLGWAGGIVVLILSWIISLYTLWQLVKMHEMDGRR